MVFFCNCIDGQQFPVKRTLEFSKWFTIKGKNLKKGDYFKDTNSLYNPFIGTWIYEANDLVFVLKLQKVQFLFVDKENKSYYWYMDRLLSTFKIIKNNIVLVDNLEEPIIETFYGKEKNETNKYGSFQINSERLSLAGEFESDFSHSFSGSIFPVINSKDGKNVIRLKFNFGLTFYDKNLKNENNPLCLLPEGFEFSKYCKE